MLRLVGEGTVRKNGGRWQAVFSMKDDETGKRTQKTISTGIPCSPAGNRGRSNALNEMARIRDEIRLTEIRMDCGGCDDLCQSIAEYIDYRYKADLISYQTKESYGYSLKHIERGLAGKTVAEVTQADVRNWVSASIDQGHSATTMKKALKLLDQFYRSELAKGAGRVDKNPCVGVEKPAPREPKPNPLTRQNLEKLNASLSDMADGILKRAIVIALNTGMRVGEVCALRWSAVDFTCRSIHVLQNVAKLEGGRGLKDTKGHERRQAPMNIVTYSYLRELRDSLIAELEAAGITDPMKAIQDIFIVTGTRELPSPQFVSKKYTVLSECLNLEGIDGSLTTFHGLRHTFATQWISGGGDIKALSDVLGHKDAAMTLNVYAGCDDLSRRQGMALAAPTLTRGYSMGASESVLDEFYAGCDDLYATRIPARLWFALSTAAAEAESTIEEMVCGILEDAVGRGRKRLAKASTA